MKTPLFCIGLLLQLISGAQTIGVQLEASVKTLETDEQFKHATISMYVVESSTGKTVFEHHIQTGMAPASCQKVITSTSAFELLGKDYRYKTTLAYDGRIESAVLKGNLYLVVSGDPTLGSWRWNNTTMEMIRSQLSDALKKAGIRSIQGDIIIDDAKWESQATPRGWIWEDVGNYYGAGARGLNWHENQYDLLLRPGKHADDSVDILSSDPALQASVLINELKTGPVGSGDRSIIYLPEDGLIGYLRGTVPAGKNTFTISGSMPNTVIAFSKELESLFDSSHIAFSGKIKNSSAIYLNKERMTHPYKEMSGLFSPTLDSINYWFLKKSVNLYGEALVKTIAYEKQQFGATDSGLALIKAYWSDRGIEPAELNIIDGSGLSPANRVTTHALVTVMQFARKQTWFPSFYTALPEANGIRMKDGYISGVRSYTGYVKSKAGATYTFSFIVNNFTGSPGTAREKIWKLLDILK